jgi:polysaccharide biosynthesis/export protein
MTTRLAVLAAAALLAGGCRGVPVEAPAAAASSDQAGKAAAAQEAAAVAAAMRQAASSMREYKIAPADLVSVTVYDMKEMDRRARVDANGSVILPLVGSVKIGGKTLGEAQELIAEKLADYVIRPQVSLFIEEYGNRMFFVMGEVQKPGSYPIPTESRVTVLEAISTAGGFTPVAAQDRTRVLRYVNGESMNYKVDVKSITREGQKDKDIFLEANDVVYVPQSLF